VIGALWVCAIMGCWAQSGVFNCKVLLTIALILPFVGLDGGRHRHPAGRKRCADMDQGKLAYSVAYVIAGFLCLDISSVAKAASMDYMSTNGGNPGTLDQRTGRRFA
jgi:hypothetical protein